MIFLLASTPAKKVTRADIEKKKEIEQKQLEEMAALKEKEKKRITENPTMEEENPNRKMAEMLNAEGKENSSSSISKNL